jgi:hypothetical protein
MTDKHTPGPWTTDVVRFTNYTLRIIKAGTDWIAHVHTQATESDIPRDAHNASLIAASPEMWDLIVELFEDPKLSLIIGGNPNQVSAVMERADKLRAKVRGTQ